MGVPESFSLLSVAKVTLLGISTLGKCMFG